MEQKFKTTILFLIPVFLLFASDGIFSIQSILPLILITFLYDCCFGGMKINQQEIMVVVLFFDDSCEIYSKSIKISYPRINCYRLYCLIVFYFRAKNLVY